MAEVDTKPDATLDAAVGADASPDAAAAAAAAAALPDTVATAQSVEDRAKQVEERAKDIAESQMRSFKAEMDRRLTTMAEERSELEKLRADKRAREQAEAEQKGNYNKAIESYRESFDEKERSWQTERKRLLDRTAQLAVDGSIKSAAGRSINPDHVAQLLRHRLRLDPETLVVTVLDEHGEPAFKEGQPTRIEDMVEEFLTSNSHMAKPSNKLRGSGAVGSGGDGNPSSGVDAGVEAKRRELKSAQDRAASTRSVSDLANVQKVKRELDAMMAA